MEKVEEAKKKITKRIADINLWLHRFKMFSTHPLGQLYPELTFPPEFVQFSPYALRYLKLF